MERYCCIYPLAIVASFILFCLLHRGFVELKWAIIRRIRRTRLEFWLIFRFWPKEKDSQEESKQRRVQEKLTKLATVYREAGRREWNLENSYWDSLGSGVLYIEGEALGYGKFLSGPELDKFVEQIRVDKTKFIKAVSSAQAFGFEVSSRPNNYPSLQQEEEDRE